MGKYPHNVSLCGYFPICSASWDTGRFPHVLCYLRNGEMLCGYFPIRSASCDMGRFPHVLCYLNTGEISAPLILPFVRIFPHELGDGEISSCPLLPQKWGNIHTNIVRIFPHSQCQLGYGEISSCTLLPQHWGNIRTFDSTICADISP